MPGHGSWSTIKAGGGGLERGRGPAQNLPEVALEP